jgi:hypothetical protein
MRLRRSATHASLPDVFRALGPAPTLAELARASKAVRRNPELFALLSEAAEGGEARDRLYEAAETSESSSFVALDLQTAVLSGPEALRREEPLEP